jgi:predicted nucleic acid-binding protein
VHAWLAEQLPDELWINDWVATEFSSALAMKVRIGDLSVEHRAETLAHFRRLIADSFGVLPVTASHFQAAARLADQHLLGLRVGDAPHLAVAIDAGARLCTLDRRLAEAGKAVGAAVLQF